MVPVMIGADEGLAGYLIVFKETTPKLGYKWNWKHDDPEKIRYKNTYVGATDDCIKGYVIDNKIDEIFLYVTQQRRLNWTAYAGGW